MAVHVGWKIPNRVIMATYSGYLTLADFETAANDISTLMETPIEGVRVHCVLHFRADVEYARELNRLKIVTNFARNNPLRGWLVVVQEQANPVMVFLSSTAAQITRAQFRIIKTLDEADIFLHHVDRTLSHRDPAVIPVAVAKKPDSQETVTAKALTVETFPDDKTATATVVSVVPVNTTELETQEMFSVEMVVPPETNDTLETPQSDDESSTV